MFYGLEKGFLCSNLMFPYKYVLPSFIYKAWVYKLYRFYIKNLEHMAYNSYCYIERCLFKGNVRVF